MTLDQYIDSINQRYKLGNATEHTFRGDLQLLLERIVPKKERQMKTAIKRSLTLINNKMGLVPFK